MTTAAKYPSVALTDFGGEIPSVPNQELTLNADITNAVLSVVTTTAIPAYWPTTGWITIDSELLRYDSFAGSTFTINASGRGAQSAYGGGAAAAHTAGAAVGVYLTSQAWAQMIAEIIAIEAQGAPAIGANLVQNSDFARRTVFGLAMPEAFADTSAWTGGSLAVAANVLTQTTASVWSKWTGSTSFFRDGRWSASFKCLNTVGVFILSKYVDANDAVTTGNCIRAEYSNGAFRLVKVIAGTSTTVATVAQAGTVNRWYWLELEAQGTTYIARLYDTGGTAAGVTKASSTLLQTLVGTISDTGVASGGVALWSDQASSQWGGIAATPGGVYVETYLPESWAVTFGGTLGGQAVAYDDAADSGPLTKQSTPVVYIPATSRTVTLQYDAPDGSMANSTVYSASYYEKNTGLGGSGVMVRAAFLEQNSAQATQATTNIDDAAEASYTRKSATVTTNAATRRFRWQFLINPSTTRTGTVRFSLPQVEQGATFTAWRNAPGDSPAPFAATRKAVNWAATTAITFTDAPIQDVVVQGNTTFTIAGAIVGQFVQLRIRQDQTGARTYTWPSNMKWSGGAAPTGSAALKLDIVTVTTDGTNLYGTYVLNY